MIKATIAEKSHVVEILSKAFDKNIGVNYKVKQDEKRQERIKHLMSISFDKCFIQGGVFLSNDKMVCALISHSDYKTPLINSLLTNLKLIYYCVGIKRLFKVLKRDTIIKNNYPKNPFFYIMFIGVYPEVQQKVKGGELLNEITEMSKMLNRPIYLETSIKENISFYNKNGFTVFKELHVGHPLFLIKKEFS